MPLFLHSRRPDLSERMDDPRCDPGKLRRTYRQFRTLNRLISRWGRIYREEIQPRISASPGRSFTLLDIGCGGGDIASRLAGLAASGGHRLEATGIDTDQRAVDYARSRANPHGVRFLRASSAELVKKGRVFDFVISNHLLHHLGAGERDRLLEEASALCRERVLFCDIERSDAAWLLFNMLSRPFFRDSFITEDGLRSIRRSYRREELEKLLPENWSVRRIFPFRVLAAKECGGCGRE